MEGDGRAGGGLGRWGTAGPVGWTRSRYLVGGGGVRMARILSELFPPQKDTDMLVPQYFRLWPYLETGSFQRSSR